MTTETLTISPQLHAGLSAYREWALSGAPEDGVFGRCGGLCLNMEAYGGYDLRDELELLLRTEFGDDWEYPFGGEEVFDSEMAKGTAYRNRLRLAFLNKVLGPRETPNG